MNIAEKNRVAVGGAAAVVGLAGALFARAGTFSDDGLRYSRYTGAVPGINETVMATRLGSLATTLGRSEDDFTRVLVGANAAEHVSTYRQRLASRLGEPAAEYGTGAMCDVFEQRVSNGSWPTIENVAGAMAGNAVEAQIIKQVVDAAVENAVAIQLGRDSAFQSRRPLSAISCPE